MTSHQARHSIRAEYVVQAPFSTGWPVSCQLKNTQPTQRDTLAASNTLTEIDLAANPPVVLVVIVDRRRQFRGRMLYKG